MNIAVCVKQVLDSSVPLRVVHGVVQADAPWPITHLGAADRAALEQALELRGQLGGCVTAISAGDTDAVEALRFCLARGTDRAVHAQCNDGSDPVAAATAVGTILASQPVDVVLCGNASGDGASGLFPAVLAAQLDWPLVTAVAAVRIEPAEPMPASFTIERRLERGDREIVRCHLPVVLAAEVSLAEPCYVSVHARQRVATLPIDVIQTEGGNPAGCTLIALEPARPRAKRVSAPATQASAMDRLAHALTGGVQQKQSGGFVEGSPDAVAQQIVRFLKEKGFLPERTGRHDG